MNNTQNLDTFESALLTELRTVAAEAAPVKSRRTGLRVGIGAAAAAAVAGALALGSSLLSPAAAFAVDETPTGAVVIRIHALSDTDGLEKALADHGIQAKVSYDNSQLQSPPQGVAPEPGTVQQGSGSGELSSQGSASSQAESGTPSDAGDACGFNGQLPFTSGPDGSDYVIKIPASSPLLEKGHTLDITSSGAVGSGITGLNVGWTDHGITCGAGTTSATTGSAS